MTICIKCKKNMIIMDDLRPMISNKYFVYYTIYTCVYCGSLLKFFYSKSPSLNKDEEGKDKEGSRVK